MLQVFSLDVYALLYLGATLSFITPYISIKFDIFPNILNEPFMVTSQLGESAIEKGMYRNCTIMLPNRTTYVELVELDMVDFYFILGMGLLHDCFASIYRRTRIVKFNFLNEPVLSVIGEIIFL